MFHLSSCSQRCFLFALMLMPLPVDAQQTDAEKVFGGHLDAVTMGDFTADGDSIVTVSFDQTARLWDIASQAELRRYTQHTGPIFCLAVSGDGTTLVTGAQDNTVRIWDLPLGRPLAAFQDHDQPVSAIAISPDGNVLVSVAADQSLRIRSLAEAEDQPGTRSGHTADVLSLAYRSDGAYFASGDQAGRVRLWSPYLEEPQAELAGHDGAIGQLQFVSNNQQLLTAGDDGVVRSWQLMPSTPSRFELGETQLIDWSFSNSQSQAVCLAEGGRAFVLNLSNGEITNEYPPLEIKATAVAHAPNNSWVCIGAEAGQAQLLNYTDGVLRGTVVGHQGRINDVAIHADSTRFATCGVDGTVRIWGQPTSTDQPQQPLHLLRTSADAQVAATSVLFTPDQQHLVCGAADGRIHQWNIGSGQLVRTIDAHFGADRPAIRELVVTPNAQVIASIGDDKTLRTRR